MSFDASQLVAHRGWPAQFPENTILGISAAIDRGAQWIELDVQMTADGVPVIYHDESFSRGCGKDLGTDSLVTKTSFDQLPSGSSAFPDRFGKQFEDVAINRLSALGPILESHRDVRSFVELKSESAIRFGHEVFASVVDQVLQAFEYRQGIAAIISKDAELCRIAKSKGWPIGWVIPAWDDANHAVAKQLDADYMFCNVKRLPENAADLWPGSWTWVGYTVNDSAKIADWLAYGLDMVETDDIGLIG